jgi:thiamine kinase-like enzyme
MGDRPVVEDVLRRVTIFADRPLRHTPMEGGLSHQIWRVDTGGRSYVLRLLDPAVSIAGLGIPPLQEIENTVLAAASGAGARVIEVLREVPALVLEFLPGRTLVIPDVRAAATIPRIAAGCRRLHAGPRFANDFDIVAKQRELLDVCARHDLAVPDGYREHLSTVDDIRNALATRPLPPRPCHNDLLAANLIDVAGDIRIVDYQLSGNNDPAFELGDIAAEAAFDPDRTAALTAAYFGNETGPALVARVRLNQILSHVVWTLWFCVHHGLLSAPGSSFDYQAEAAGKWDRAVHDLDDPGLGKLIDTVVGRSTIPRF